ncbi:hypothetical protein ACLOJK_007070 [Asimina triloba]
MLLQIKARVLGYGHSDYADTMYHLGMVLHLQGKEKDAEALIRDSIRILEEGGLGESMTCIKRIRYLSQFYPIFTKSPDLLSMSGEEENTPSTDGEDRDNYSEAELPQTEARKETLKQR